MKQSCLFFPPCFWLNDSENDSVSQLWPDKRWRLLLWVSLVCLCHHWAASLSHYYFWFVFAIYATFCWTLTLECWYFPAIQSLNQIMQQYYSSTHSSNSSVSLLAMSTFNDVLSINVVDHLTLTEQGGHTADETVHTLKDMIQMWQHSRRYFIFPLLGEKVQKLCIQDHTFKIILLNSVV